MSASMHCAVHALVQMKRKKPHLAIWQPLNTPQPCRLTTKLRIVIDNVKTKVVIKFEASEVLHVETRARKLWNVYTLPYMWKSHPHMYWTHLNHVAWPRNLELWLIAWKQRLWSSLKPQRCCMWKRGSESYEMCTLCHTCENLILTCTEHTSTMSPDHET